MNLQNNQIGGKGTVRRKRKKTGHNFTKNISNLTHTYKNKITRINQLIQNINNNQDYNKFKLYLDSELEEIGYSIDKISFKKTAKDDYQTMKDFPLGYVYHLLVEDITRPLTLNLNLFENCQSKLDDDFIDIIKLFLSELENKLEKIDF